MSQNLSESLSTHCMKLEKAGRIDLEDLLPTPTDSHKIHPPSSLNTKHHLKLYSATMKANLYVCKYAYNLTLEFSPDVLVRNGAAQLRKTSIQRGKSNKIYCSFNSILVYSLGLFVF